MRGHLQTWLTHGLSRLSQFSRRRITAEGLKSSTARRDRLPSALPPARDPYDPPAVSIRWISVIITSVLFALLHPIWMTPPIFVLAIASATLRANRKSLDDDHHARCLHTTSTILFLYVVHLKRSGVLSNILVAPVILSERQRGRIARKS